METLRLRLERPLPGIDHMNAVDPKEFASHHSEWDFIAGALDIDSINDFYVYEGEYGKNRTRWHAASKGLKAIRAVIAHYEKAEKTSWNERTLALFRRIESILDDADLHDVRFCFVGNY